MSKTMSIHAVISSLDYLASVAHHSARSTTTFRDVVVHTEQARRWAAMAASVRLAATQAPTVKAPVRAKKGAAVSKARMAKPMGALSFWAMHGEAVAEITAEYGPEWQVKAPFGETVIVTLASGLRSCTTERGTKLRWPRDCRMPAAAYWMGGELPVGVTVVGDYVRHTDAAPVRDAAWHKAHGYVWMPASNVSQLFGKGATNGTAEGGWVFELEARAAQSRIDAITAEHAYKAAKVEATRMAKLEAAALSYGPQAANDDERMDLAEAAD